MIASLRSAPFVGRERELAALSEQLEAAGRLVGGVVMIAGEPGIGKTRLVSELAERGRSAGWVVLVGRAHQAEGMPPFLPFLEALRSYVRTASVRELRARLGGGASDVARLVPEVRARLPDVPEAPQLSTEMERYRFFEAVSDFMIAIAGSSPRRETAADPPAESTRGRGSPRAAGLLLVLDDLHWADTPSLLLLAHFARRLRDAPILVAGTYRDSEVGPGHPLSDLLTSLTRDPVCEQLLLTGLGDDDVRRFIELTAAVTPSADLLAAVCRETAGNPLFVSELVRLMAVEGRLQEGDAAAGRRLPIPQSVRQVIGRRVDHLSSNCNQTLMLAAVVGREFDLFALERAGELGGDPLLDALEEAEFARVIAAVPDTPRRYAFSHPLIRETLYSQVLTGRRVRLHRRVGEALEALYVANPDAHLAELAHHFLEAAPGGDVRKAISYTRRAGDRALTLFAYEDAVALYEAALRTLVLLQDGAEADRCGLLLALAQAQTRAGSTAQARETFRRTADLARLLRMPEHLARAALGYGGYRGTPGIVDAALVDLLEEAIGALDEQPSPLRARALARLAMELYQPDMRAKREQLSRQAVAEARACGDAAAMAAALVGRHYALHEPENLPDRLATAAELVALAEAGGDREIALQGHYLYVIDALEQGDIDTLDAQIAAHDRLAGEVRQPLYLWRTDLLRAMQAMLEGRFEESGRLAQRAFQVSQRAQIANSLPAYATQVLTLRLQIGGLEEIEAVQRRHVEQYPAVHAYLAGQAMLLLQLGRTDEARAVLERLSVDDFVAIPHDDGWLTTVACLAEVCTSANDERGAAALYRLLRPYADRNVVINAAIACLGPVPLYLGMLAGVLGEWTAAELHFDSAMVMAGRLRSLPYTARTWHAHAAMLSQRNQPGDLARGAELTARVIDTARSLGMIYLAEQAAALLHQIEAGLVTAKVAESNVALREEAVTATLPDGLTLREAEVLRLLADGRTNREIAADLFLSSRTVDHHVAAIYGKIGAHRRADAAAYALRQGLTSASTV